MARYLVSAFAALITLFAVLYGLMWAVGPGSPGERAIVGQLELLMPGEEPRGGGR